MNNFSCLNQDAFTTPKKGCLDDAVCPYSDITWSSCSGYSTPLRDSNGKNESTILSCNVKLFSPGGLLSPGGAYRNRKKQFNKKERQDRDKKCQSKSRLDFFKYATHSEAFHVAKKRAKQAMKRFLYTQKNLNKRKHASVEIKSKIARPATPHRKKRGVEFQYDSLSECFCDTTLLEKQLRGGLRLQMIAQTKNESFDKNSAFFDNYIATLHEEGSKYALELWRPMTGEVIHNFFDRVNEMFLDENIGLIFVTTSAEDPASLIGPLGGCDGKSDVVIRHQNEFSTKQLCMLLSLCHLQNQEVGAVRSDETGEKCQHKVDQYTLLTKSKLSCCASAHDSPNILIAAASAAISQSQQPDGKCWGRLLPCLVCMILPLVLLASILRMNISQFELTYFLQ